MPVVMDADRMSRAHAHRARNPRAQPRQRASRSSASARAACRWRAGSPAPERHQRRRRADRRARHHALSRRPDASAVGPQPVVRRTEIPFSIDDRTHPARRRRALHRPDDPRGARRADRLRPAAARSSSSCWSTAATASCRSRPTTSARTCRRRAKQSVQVRLQEIDGVDEVLLEARPTPWSTATSTLRLAHKHLLGIADLDARRDRADPRHRRGDEGSRQRGRSRRCRRCAADGRQPVLRAEHAHAHLVRDRREAPQRRHAEHRDRDVERRRRARRWSTPRATSRRWRPT